MQQTIGRQFILISGSDTLKFMQSMMTNDINKLTVENMIYSACLSAQGKFLFDFFLSYHEHGLLMDIHESVAQMAKKHLTLYKLRSDVHLEFIDLNVSTGICPTYPGAFRDPRHKSLGWRAYDNRATETVYWDALRVKYVIPKTSVELTPETYILEAGFERLKGVDFKKGCFPGQEVVARMKHKTTLLKGLVKVKASQTVPVGTDIINADGKVAGTIYTQDNNEAIAFLRFNRATDSMTAGEAQITWQDHRELCH